MRNLTAFPVASEPVADESADPQVLHGASRLLIINADDWGRDHLTTNRTLECVLRGAVSSVSAMVFMQDSERAAGVARTRRIDAGLHLNLTTPFSSPRCPDDLAARQEKVAAYLSRNRYAQAIFNPWLAASFGYVVKAQIEEYCRLYGTQPERIDGHHHMHLCANVLWSGLLPYGITVRRSFSFKIGEKSLWNRGYRQATDRRLARRHRVTDFFFSLAPLEPLDRLQRIFSLARRHVVEVETHPVNEEEYRFLAGGEIFRHAGDQQIASRYLARLNGHAKG
ncbi:MAG TPA: ChbG/HpnK family deacetylase [Terriglobia bacterium]|nr:ChbG/HpnK family deacetylase [Terriglobia bacterium]